MAPVRLYLMSLLIAVVLCGGLARAINLDRILQAVQLRYGQAGVAALKDWAAAIEVFRAGGEPQKLKDVNDYFNRKVRFEDDTRVWGQSDYWATPIEMLIKGAGDCEDFAIAKYFSLRHLGIPIEKLRLNYVRARIGGASSSLTQAHMVLTYFPAPDAEPLVLDNLVSEIRPASRRPDLTPIFSFNTEGLWVTGQADSAQGGGGRLSRWRGLLAKMHDEGFE